MSSRDRKSREVARNRNRSVELQREAKYKEILSSTSFPGKSPGNEVVLSCETCFVVQETVSYTANNNSFSDQAYLDVDHVLLFAWFMDLD